MHGLRENAADAQARDIPEGAALALMEHRLSTLCIYLFLLLNFFGQIFFRVNGSGFFAAGVLALTGGLLFWTFIYRFPMPFLRFFGAFCGGLFACQAYNAFEGERALCLLLYWMVLSVLTIRMKRAFTASFFLLSIALLTRLV